MTNSGKHISLPAPLSDGDPVEWFRRFEICCRANDWGDEMKAKKLPTLLEGEAIAVWFELTSEEQEAYGTAKEKIIDRMAPARFVSLADFHNLKDIAAGRTLIGFCARVETAVRTGATNCRRRSRRYKQTTVTSPVSQWIAKQFKYTATSGRPSRGFEDSHGTG